ncbi:hypothetical protein J2T60_000792 [Natronospira proteinivora]|uniref:Lipoprotein n=1 Tax=Natronospira proteinivora TaxID=1807133 RepID=A0ABT1G6A0_9GAMM|nr:DUF6279 family lipoprotein [Natronospira proteinivora]MCP1726827.1 hypothetical protein [Natronospira proteinivora]
MPGPRLILLLLLTALLLAACSRVQFVYDRADWLGARWVANYLDLDREQRRWIRSEIDSYRDFHRRQRLPEINAFLNTLIDDIEQQRFRRTTLVDRLGNAETMFRQTARDVLPTSAEVLADLNAEQRQSLAQRFQDRQEEQQERQREREQMDEQERRQALRQGAESWLGSVSEGQIDHLISCRDQLPEVGLLQQSWETARQKELLERMENSESVESLGSYLEDWWLDYREQPPELAGARAVRRVVTVDCLEVFLPTLSEDQRGHLLDRLKSYQREVSRLLE